MQTGKVTAYVPVRKGSQRLKRKHFLPFGPDGRCLLQVKLTALKQVPEVGRIVVMTDSDEAIRMATEHKVEWIRREAKFCTSTVDGSTVFEHYAVLLDRGVEEAVMFSPPTAPLIRPETYSRMIQAYFNRGPRFDSLVSADLIKHHLWTPEAPLNYDYDASPNTQDLPDIYMINFGACIINRALQQSLRNAVGRRPAFFALPKDEAVDIDDEQDFRIAQALWVSRAQAKSG